MRQNLPHILIVASENDALPRVNGKGAKVGGIGDVIRDIPPALGEAGMRVTVVNPTYGFLQHSAGFEKSGHLSVPFAGKKFDVNIFSNDLLVPGVHHVLIDIPIPYLGNPPESIYHHDTDGRPFATDATKFAFFSRAVTTALVSGAFGNVDALHLHDWHTGLIPALLPTDERAGSAGKIRTVFSIHNLSLQGIRPFEGDESSLAAWFPSTGFDYDALRDPRWSECFNPMAAGIRLSDVVHAVSPSYAKEITVASDPEHGRWGGEGLETDLLQADSENRLIGILNGSTYSNLHKRKLAPRTLVSRCVKLLSDWLDNSKGNTQLHELMRTRLKTLANEAPNTFFLTGVSRLVDQKVGLLLHEQPDGTSIISRMLNEMKDQNAVYVFLGSGEKKYSDRLTELGDHHSNFVFLEGYDDHIAEILYRAGDAFLMPSLFEPCGISQMLAMREGQPCIVHHVGGLKDTVSSGINGFAFEGRGLDELGEKLVSAVVNAVSLWRNDPRAWAGLRREAKKARFQWQDTVERYRSELYHL